VNGTFTERLEVFNDVLVQPFMPDRAIIALDISVLLRLSGLDVLDGNALFISSFQQLTTDILRPIIYPNGSIKAANDPFGWQRKIYLDAQTLAVKIIQHCILPF